MSVKLSISKKEMYRTVCVFRFIKAFFFLFIVGMSFRTELYAWSPVNGVAICTTVNQQEYPTIVSDGSGGAIITWEDERSGNFDIYTQRVNSSGYTLWTTNGVAICTAANNHELPTIVSDESGGGIITWEDERNGSTYNIYAQRVNSTGSTLWMTNGVAICTAANNQEYPMLVSDSSGGAIITWQDDRNGSTYNIYSQRVNSSGSTLWTLNGVAICTAGNNQELPTIVSDGSGGAVITWQDERNGNFDIYSQRVNTTGSTLWTLNGVAICTVTNNKESPTIASDTSGGAIITWEDERSGSTYNIYAQRVNSTGSTLWVLNGVVISTAAIEQKLPMIVSDGSGGAVITWEDNRGGNFDIYAQRVNSSGTNLWTLNGVAVCTAANNQEYPTIVSDESGGAIITWQDNRSGSYINIYAQRVNSNGSTVWITNGVTICTAANSQEYPTIVNDTSGGAIIAWEDYRNGNFDIYAQSINSTGLTLLPIPTVGFYATPTSGNTPLLVQFTDTSGNNPTSWVWYFGDGGTSTTQNPSHIYTVVSQPTTYAVQLIASNNYGSAWSYGAYGQITPVPLISVLPPMPAAGFYATPSSGNTPLQVQFTDTSGYNPTSWAWNFGDGGTSTTQNPSHLYAVVSQPTTYAVRLIAINNYGSTTSYGANGQTTSVPVISVLPPVPSVGFYAIPTSGPAPLLVQFTDTSGFNPIIWAWSFGDGGTSTVENPSYSYNSTGTFTVQLIASNIYGTSTAIVSNYIYTVNTTGIIPPLLTNPPNLKAFVGVGLTTVFNLENYNSGGMGTSFSLPTDFLSLGTTSGSYESQAIYSIATTGINTYQISNLAGSSSASGLVKYSTYRIRKLPHVGLTPGSSWDVNVENYTYNTNGLALPPSFGNSTALYVSNLSNVTAYWVNDSVIQITSLQSFTGAVDVNVTASPNATAPFGSDVDVEQIQVYTNLLSNSTFSTANDLSIWTPGLEVPPGRTTLATQSWVSSYTDSAGTQANGVWQFNFADGNGGVKCTPALSDWINITTGQWYTFRIRLVADVPNNSHSAFLFGFTNYPNAGTQTDIIGNVLFGVPTVWTWQEAPLLAHGTSTTGYPQFQFKAGGSGNIYIDEIQILNAAPTLTQARSNIYSHYLYGQFTSVNDPTGWGQQLYSGASSAPGISVDTGLVLNFAGSSSSTGEFGIKWTANDGIQGNVYSFPANPNYDIDIGLNLSIQSGNFNSLGIILAAVYGIQTAGQVNIGIPPSNLMAVAGIGVLISGNYYAEGDAINPYYQAQFGAISDLPGY
jgi:PKD repeat protein